MNEHARTDNMMTVLNLAQRAAGNFGGWAIVGTAEAPISTRDRKRSQEALIPYERPSLSLLAENNGPAVPYNDSGHGKITSFQIDIVPVSSLARISAVLAEHRALTTDTKNIQRDYIAPVVLPHIQSDDPAIAASAMITTSLLLDKTMRSSELLRKRIMGANFAKTRFNWPDLDLSHFDRA
jgi:hypothetical protein